MRKEGRKMIHVQKWAPISREDAYTLLRGWGYKGHSDLLRRAPLKRAPQSSSVAGASPKRRAERQGRADGTDPEEPVDVDEEEEPVVEEPRQRRRRTRGTAAGALETASVLDSMLETGPKRASSAGRADDAGPLEARLAGLRSRLQEKVGDPKAGAAKVLADKALAVASATKPRLKRTRSRDVAHALQKALRPRKKQAEDYEGEGSSSDELDDDDALEVAGDPSSLVVKRRQLKKYAQEHPGQLLVKGLANMREQVGALYGDDDDGSDRYAPVVNRYLLSVLLPNYPAKQQSEDQLREMRTLALGIDLILNASSHCAWGFGMVALLRKSGGASREAHATEGGWQGQTSELLAGGTGRGQRGAGEFGHHGEGQASSPSTGGGEPDTVERPDIQPPAAGPVMGLAGQGLYTSFPQARADSAPGLGVIFEAFGVPRDMCLQELAEHALCHAKCHNKLQLGITLLQLLVATLDGRGDTSFLSSLFGTITPFGKGTQTQETKGRQRDLLPLPLPAFGALLSLVPKLQRTSAGILLWDPAEARKTCKQQLKKLVEAACFQAWRLLSVLVLNGESSSWSQLVPASVHIETRSQRVALAGLSRRCAWWTGQPLQARPEVPLSELISARHVDYSGDAVLKALPLRLEELAPGLPEDGVAGSLDALANADDVVGRWLGDPTHVLLNPESWPRPLPSASMNVTPHEWERIVEVLYKKGIVEAIELSEVFHVGDQPVLNGVFAVPKSGTPAPGECRVTRLIMNLVPANALQKLMPGDLPTLAGSRAFYAWRLPKTWRKLMTFKLPVPGHIVGRPDRDMVHVASAVIPMGWINAVSLFQHLHRQAGLAREPWGAGLDPAMEWRRDKPVPKGAVGSSGAWFQYYLDDFDCPEKVPRHKWEAMANTISPTHARQRLSYNRIGIGIAEKKAHIREPCVVRMGAEVDGVNGFLSAPRDKMLETGWLALFVIAKPSVSPRMMMVVLGRLTRCFEFRRPLMSLINKCWPKSMWCRGRRLPTAHIHELVCAVSLLGLALVDMRTPVSGLVTCSDASTSGGGMCASSGLTSEGVDLLEQLDQTPHDGERFRPQGSVQGYKSSGPRVLIISLYDGSSGVMCALTRLDCAVQGYASAGGDSLENRLSRTRFPGMIELGRPGDIDAATVSKLVSSIGYRLDFVLLAGSLPSQESPGVKGQATPGGDHKSALKTFTDLYEMLTMSFGVPVHLMLENLFELRESSFAALNEALQLKPYLVDAAAFTGVRRPRLFWVTWEVSCLPGESIEGASGKALPAICCLCLRVLVHGPELSSFPQDAISRWHGDRHRFDVSCYLEPHMAVTAEGVLRLPTLSERERLMGFPDNYFSAGLHPKLKGEERQTVRSQLIGGTFCVFSVMVVLDSLLEQFDRKASRQTSAFFNRGAAPPCWTDAPVFVKHAAHSDEVTRLVTHYLRVAERGGTDVRLDAGIPFRAKAWPRSGIQSHLFNWAVVHGYPWRHVAHINVLELQAVVNSVKWRLRRSDNLEHRVMLLLPMGKQSAPKPRPRLTLRDQMVTAAMQLRYARAVLNFLTFLADSDLASHKISHLCDAASEWVEFLYADGERKGLASDGLAGLHFYLPQCHGRLKLAWKLVKVWQRIEPPMHVLPLSPLVVLGMAGLAAGVGLSEVAAGLLVCFDGLLRSGEFYQLRVSDATFYSDRAALRLGLTKGGKRTGQEEMVIINSCLAVRWLRKACAGKRGSQLVMTQGAGLFRKWFKILLAEFRLQDLHINVYSLRRGGATWDFLEHQSMERTLLRGRWASTSSARVYLQDAVATVAHLKLAKWQTALAQQAMAFL
ncbi:unnamed protein product [Symbiodinium sp. CCMP2592]|nr:unnamed protein product [Symbiodinium sp. CCMP2592]